MKHWIYNNNPVTSLTDFPDHERWIGFCYKITNHKTGAIYIGKKNFLSVRKKKLPKSKLSTDLRRKKYEVVTKESDWKEYYGSNKQLQEDVEKLGEHFFTREIIELACNKKLLNYLELKYQILNDVLSFNSYNGNILGRYFPKDLKPCEVE
jgi:predicted SPOUT superfamily RNA methylase MTH1